MKSMEQAFLAGATDYDTKPFDVEELGARLAATYQTHGDQNDEISGQRGRGRYVARETERSANC